MKPTLHVVSLPHTQVVASQSSCAYTQKVRHFCNFMSSLDYPVYLYASEDNEVDCIEAVSCITKEEQHKYFDGHELSWSCDEQGWPTMNTNAIQAIKERSRPNDYLCLIAGTAQQPIARAIPSLIPVEWGIGYAGTFAPFRVFESYAWMHTIYGEQYGAYTADGNFYDTVIPNSFNPIDFPLGDGGGDYLFYIGRLITRKGLIVVHDIAERTGLPVKVAGAGTDGYILDGLKNVEMLGSVLPEQRAELMGNARATLVPTLYVEPFGGVACESMLCGTPVITTDWGAFTETVENGLTGYRGRTLRDFERATEDVLQLDRKKVRKRAIERFSVDNVKHQYDAYFMKLEEVAHGDGWYS